jgi:hypothetical protein
MTNPPPGSRFEEFLAAYARMEHEAYLRLDMYRKFGASLLQGLRRYAGIPEGQLVYVPLNPQSEGERGSYISGMGYGDDEWFHVAFRIVFPSPNTSLPRAIGIRLRVLERDEKWIVKTYADAELFELGENTEENRIRFYNHLMDELTHFFTTLRPVTDLDEQSVLIGFRLPRGEG